uniref:Small ribosomal subunit protein uS10m n=1 Tax=Graphocephala atropunctata TaxID=36148 RepID=A0A1B6LCG4_9HEMI
MLSLMRNLKQSLIIGLKSGSADFKEFPAQRIITSRLQTSVFTAEKHLAQLNDIQSNVDEPEAVDKLYKLIEVEVRGNDPAVLKSYAWYASTAAHHLGIEVGRIWTPQKAHHERYTVLRSIHVNKKCRVQYEFRTYFHFLQFHRLTGSTADTFLEYIQRNLPEGVAMKVTKVALEGIPEHIRAPDKVEATESL